MEVETTAKPVILDLFCCAGGASMGYHRAGFEVIGVDIDPQPNYPFKFYQCDAIDYLGMLLDTKEQGIPLNITAIHASPPCQAHSLAQRIQGNVHEDLIPRTRHLLDLIGLPYIIENVVGAPLREDLILCGAMFGLGTYRHRVFELSGFSVSQPPEPKHTKRTAKMGRPPAEGEMMHIVGNFSNVRQARVAMGIDWMPRDKMAQAIPPAFSEYIGRALFAHLAK